MKKQQLKLTFLILLLTATSLFLSSCALGKNTSDPPWLVVATSQELADAGLITAITPAFEDAYRVRIKWLTVSSCEALNFINRDSRVDVLLVSGGDQLDKAAGPTFDFCQSATGQAANASSILAGPLLTLSPQVATASTPGSGAPPLPTPTALNVKYLLTERHTVFWSPLVLVGPPTDPLHLANVAYTAKAFKTIGEQNGPFLVAGQEPGLVDLEEAWWRQVGTGELALRGTRYKVFDGDARATLAAAESSGSYTVVPLDTFLTFHQANKSSLLFDKDNSMFLPYEALLHNPTRCNNCDLNLARQFINYLASSSTQQIITKLGQSQFKAAFFRPASYPVYRPH